MAFPDAVASLETIATEPFGTLQDLRCPVTVQLGTGTLTVRRCLALATGDVVVLHEAAGENLDIRVNGVLLARGEVVIVEDVTSLRITTVDVSTEAGRLA